MEWKGTKKTVCGLIKYAKGLKKEKGLSTRQLSRLTGISRGVVIKA